MRASMKQKNTNSTNLDWIDFDLFNAQELQVIFSFYELMEKNSKHKINREQLKEAYRNYKNTIHSISLEKKYNAFFFQETKISIFDETKDLFK
jgi:uncharacterized protein YktA (UPF0223 family)